MHVYFQELRVQEAVILTLCTAAQSHVLRGTILPVTQGTPLLEMTTIGDGTLTEDDVRKGGKGERHEALTKRPDPLQSPSQDSA